MRVVRCCVLSTRRCARKRIDVVLNVGKFITGHEIEHIHSAMHNSTYKRPDVVKGLGAHAKIYPSLMCFIIIMQVWIVCVPF